MPPDYERRPMDKSSSEPKNFHEYLESVGWELTEERVTGHHHFLEEAKEALKGLDAIIRGNEGVSFAGGGHFSHEDMQHITQARRAISAAAVGMAGIKTKAKKPIIRFPPR